MLENRKEALNRGLSNVDRLLSGSTAGDKESQNPRFQKCLERVEKGELGPIKTAEITLPRELGETVSPEQVDLYVRLMKDNPSTQPGRPTVNLVGDEDATIQFVCLTHPELILAAKELHRPTLLVLLVRLDESAAALMAGTSVKPFHHSPQKRELLPHEVARLGGFMELPIDAITQSQNVRTQIDPTSVEMRSLVHSIETIGLQNPPVVEVRGEESKPTFVCVSGHRRLLALSALGHTTANCSLRIFESEAKARIAALAENLNRSDLGFLDRAEAYGNLVAMGAKAEQLKALFDSDIRTTNKYLRAAAWNGSVRERIRENETRLSIRFLLNGLAAGERTTEDLHRMLDNELETKKPAKAEGRMETLSHYFREKSLSSETQQVILKFLSDMKIPGWGQIAAKKLPKDETT